MITEVELSIIPQDMVERLTFETSFADFVEKMMDLQEKYTEAVNGTSSRTVADVLSDYEGTQVHFRHITSCFPLSKFELAAFLVGGDKERNSANCRCKTCRGNVNLHCLA